MNLINFFKSLFASKSKHYEYRAYFDMLGNSLSEGDMVLPVKYNEANRRGYLSIRKDAQPCIFRISSQQKNFIKLEAYKKLSETNKIVPGHKKAYVHINY